MPELHITQFDRDNERRLANFLEERWSCDIWLTADPATVDAICARDKHVMAVVEIKQRPKYDSYKMSHFWIDAQKLDEMQLMAERLDCTWVLVVQEANGRILSLSEPLSRNYKTETFTRDREGEKPDVICLIPTVSWTIMRERARQ